MNLAGTRNETNYDPPQMLATVTRISKGKKTAISHFFFQQQNELTHFSERGNIKLLVNRLNGD